MSLRFHYFKKNIKKGILDLPKFFVLKYNFVKIGDKNREFQNYAKIKYY